MLSAPALRSSVSYDEYARTPGVRISALKELGRSALHYRHHLVTPKESRPLTLGSAAHCAVLEPERFERDHAIWGERTDGGALRPRRGKDWESFAALNAGRTILTEDEHTAALAIRDAVRGCDVAMRYLRKGEAEVTMQWTDASTGTPMKGRADWLTKDAGYPVLVGLKTTRDCRSILFGVQAARLSYHLAWAAYADGYAAITGTAPKMIEIVVESAPPHDVAVYVITSEIIEQGRGEYHDLLVRLAACERDNDWPGAVPGETQLRLPPWAFDTDDDVSGLGLEGFSDERSREST